jgi:RNA polymerase sigma-70 factor (ECF subfamily)
MIETPKMEIEDKDADLLRSVRLAPEGDFRAFEQLIEQYQKRILADCRYLTRDESNSEDLAQEVFVKAFFGIRSFDGRSSFRHWLQKIKVHHCLNHLKKQSNKNLLPIDEESSERYEQLQVAPDIQGELMSEVRSNEVGEILNRMPSTLRIPLVMCDMDELSYEEIASCLGIGLSAVKMRIKRAREYFRRVYDPGKSEQ